MQGRTRKGIWKSIKYVSIKNSLSESSTNNHLNSTHLSPIIKKETTELFKMVTENGLRAQNNNLPAGK